MTNEEIIRTEKRADYYADRADDLTFQLGAERREHRTTRKYLTAYRWIALIGWVAFLVVLTAKEI